MAAPYICAIRQLGGIGDVISMGCVYRGLREKYPSHEIHLVTDRMYMSGALVDVAQHNPFIDELHLICPYEGTTNRTKDIWRKYYKDVPSIDDELLLKRADLVIDLNTACVDYEWHAMRNGGIKKPRYVVWCEKAEVIPSSYAPVYQITQEERQRAREEALRRSWRADGRPVIGLAVKSADTKRALGIGRLSTICETLNARGARPVIVDAIFQFEGYEALVGRRIAEILPMIEQMDALISVDSGVLHMAGAVGTPIIGVFGPTDPEMRMREYVGSALNGKASVDCAPCWYGYPCLSSNRETAHYRCMKTVAPEVIVEEALRWTSGRL